MLALIQHDENGNKLFVETSHITMVGYQSKKETEALEPFCTVIGQGRLVVEMRYLMNLIKRVNKEYVEDDA